MNAALLADLKGNALAGLTNAVLSCDLLLRSSLYGFQVPYIVQCSAGVQVTNLDLIPVLWNLNYFLRFRFRLLKSYGFGSDF
jgi:hypothetical protein